MPERQVILLAEDLEDDILLIRRAFEKAGIKNPLFVVRNGVEAISYLSGSGKHADREEYPLPDLLLLDLKMPGIDGFGVLRWIKQQSKLYNLRVVVLTASDSIRDAEQAYRLGADSFMVKAVDFQDTLDLAKTIIRFWLSKDSEIYRPTPAQFNQTKPNPSRTP